MNIYHKKIALHSQVSKAATKQKIKFGKLDCRAEADAQKEF